MKKIFLVIISLFICCSITANINNAFALTNKNIRVIGDIDENGIVNGIDATYILAVYAKLSTTNGDGSKIKLEEIAGRYIADINGDGRIDGVDSTMALSIYSACSVGKDVNLEVLFLKDNTTTATTIPITTTITTKSSTMPSNTTTVTTTAVGTTIQNMTTIHTNNNDSSVYFSVNDEIQFTEKSWSLFDIMEFKDEPDAFIFRNQTFTVKQVYPNNWYGVIVGNSNKMRYMYLSQKYGYAFKKIGNYTEEMNATTTTTVTTTKLTTTSYLTTTICETTTGRFLTYPVEQIDIPVYTNMQKLKFNGLWFDYFSGSDALKSIAGKLTTSQCFWIKNYRGNGVYEIILNNENDSYIINISKEDEIFFEKLPNNNTFKFVGDANLYVRSSPEINEGNIIRMLQKGDFIEIVSNEQVSGWIKIVVNIGNSGTEVGYVYNNMFEKVY